MIAPISTMADFRSQLADAIRWTERLLAERPSASARSILQQLKAIMTLAADGGFTKQTWNTISFDLIAAREFEVTHDDYAELLSQLAAFMRRAEP